MVRTELLYLGGTLDVDTLDTTDAVKAVLHGLKRHNNFSEISTHITNEEFMPGFKRWDERTSTSPSGRNLSSTRL